MYDMVNMDMQNKIIVLMTVGWAIMMFSYFVQSKGWLKTNEEDNDSDSWTNINELISQIELPWIHKVTFNINWEDSLSSKSKKIIKIVYFIADKYWKAEFKAWELNNMYEYMITHYKSELNKKSYTTVTWALKKFVDNWWEVVFK